MLDLGNVYDFRPSLIGTISVGLTAVGAPIDTQGFSQVLAMLTTGALSGTDAGYSSLAVKIQESATATATGTAWTDIDDGQVNGTMEFTTVGQFVGTNDVLNCESIYEKVSDGTRKRYIRAHATAAGTDGANPKYSVGFLLGTPVDTVHYIVSPTTQDTGNAEFTIGL